MDSASKSPDGSRPTSGGRLDGDSRGRNRSIDVVMVEDRVDEQSPLLQPWTSEDVETVSPLESVSSPSPDRANGTVANTHGNGQETKSSWYLFLLTLAMFGLQIAWSVELSNGSPYLLSLGISKSLLAFVWIAGPLSGTLVQPYVGIKSDRCRSRFGKRRPFMVGGGIATVISLLALAWARELVAGFLGIFGVAKNSTGVGTTAIVFAVIMIYVLDFAINVIQAGVRAFIVDNAPMHQQDAANAWASRIGGVGGIVLYLLGYINLPQIFPFFGETQFKVLCVIASLAMLSTLLVSCVSIQERDPRLEGEPANQKEGAFAFFRQLYRSIRKLPPQIRAVCVVQFFAWIGWFPFLFYITTYIGEIYVQPYFAENPHMSEEEVEQTWEHATRIGTFALFMFAIVTFVASVVLPWIVASSYKAPDPAPTTPMTPSRMDARVDYFATSHEDTRSSKSTDWNFVTHRSPITRLWTRLSIPEIPWLTLRRAWMLSHIFFALLCWLTLFVHTTTAATVLVSLIGIPWAMTNWAPFALIAEEISKRDRIRRGEIPPPATQDGEVLAHEDPAESADQAGVVLGIHNVAIAAPQVIATLVSSAIFRALQKPRGSVGDESVAWVLRFGGICALVAAWLTRRVGEERGR